MEDKATLPIRVLESRIWKFWWCKDGLCCVAEELHFSYSDFFFLNCFLSWCSC